MKLPNGYGSVVCLGSKRRKPYAVRITTGYRLNDNGTCTQLYKYLAYFEKRKDAITYLAAYNSGQIATEHESVVKVPLFRDLYESWIEYKQSLKNKIGENTVRNYNIAFKMLSDIHYKRMNTITVDDLQDVVSKYNDKSKSTIGFIRTVLKQTFSYAIKRGYIEKDITQYVDYEYTESAEAIHSDFSIEEIKKMWEYLPLLPNIKYALIMCYTGMRPQEMLLIENKNVYLEERYMIGGMKTQAGRNRIIPIHQKLLPIIRELYNPENKYLIVNTKGGCYTYANFYQIWRKLMESLEMDHLPHDGRHTLATALDRVKAPDTCIKLILGHTIEDFTKRVYTHKATEELIQTIDMLDY